MSLATGAFLVAMAFITAAISGVFGMAGGLLLKGALALVLPVSAVFVTHGLLQLVANGWRAILHRKHVKLVPASSKYQPPHPRDSVSSMSAISPTDDHNDVAV